MSDAPTIEECLRAVEIAAIYAPGAYRSALIAAVAHLRQLQGYRLTAAQSIDRRIAEEASIKAAGEKASAAFDRARTPT